MKRIFVSIMLAAMILPGFSSAFFFEKPEQMVHIDTPITQDAYVMGGNVTVSDEVAGDLVIFGGNVDVAGQVAQDIIGAGGQINISGPVLDDVRVAGGQVFLSSQVGGDLLVAGGNVVIKPEAVVKGDLAAGAGSLHIAGTIQGNARIGAGNVRLDGQIKGNVMMQVEDANALKLGENASIQGTLSYKAKEQIPALEKIVKSGDVKFTKLDKKSRGQRSDAGGWWMYYTLYSIVWLIIFGFLFLMVAKKFFAGVGDNLLKSPGKSFLVGFLTYAVIPFAILILMISVIGISFGILFGVMYIYLFVWMNLINVLGFSALVIQKMGGFKKLHWLKILGIVAIFAILAAVIPVIDIIAAFFALGAILMKKGEILKKALK